MANAEQQVSELLMYNFLVPQLATVDVKVLEVVTDHQISNPENFEAELAFESGIRVSERSLWRRREANAADCDECQRHLRRSARGPTRLIHLRQEPD
ncbi:hypothetical protein ACHAWF_014541 [Thalassiosira exigua]